MYRITAVEVTSLDGVVQSPGRADEDPSGGFTQGGWAAGHMAQDPEAATAAMSGGDDTAGIVFGRRTYDDLVGHWLTTPEPNPFTEVLRATPKYVVSRTADAELPYPNSTLLHGEAARTVADLKATGDGTLILLGSATLLHALQRADLVDGYILTVLPLVVGAGKTLFSDGAVPTDLRLDHSVVTARGAFVGTYRRV